MIMRYEPGVYDPNMRVPVPTAFDRIVWIIVGYWFIQSEISSCDLIYFSLN